MPPSSNDNQVIGCSGGQRRGDTTATVGFDNEIRTLHSRKDVRYDPLRWFTPRIV